MTPKKLIGHAGELLDLLTLTQVKRDQVKVLLAGQPGIGKTEIARRLAMSLCGHEFDIDVMLGREVTIHEVKRWRADFACSSMFGTGWKVKVVNEIDCCQRDALDQMLDLLDQLPAKRGVIGTTNCAIEDLPERFRTRFQRYAVRAPAPRDIEDMLRKDFGLPESAALQLATLCGGNVRAAIDDAETWLPAKAHNALPIVMQTSLAALGI